MPEDITQKLGFDASKAIQELERLRGELNNFKQSLQSVSGALRKFPSAATPAIKTFRELANAANSASTAIQNVALAGGASQAAQAVSQSFDQANRSLENAGRSAAEAGRATQNASQQMTQGAGQASDALDRAGRSGSNAGREISLSWKTVARVVQAQVIVRAVNTIIGAFRDAREEAIQFSVAVAEAFTISGGALGGLDQMQEGVRQVTLALGETGEVVAEGVYQTLSNQVVEAGDALRFTQQAGELAIATNSELREAVNALSSVMNSYGLEASEARRVSDVLFKTIELGRLRMGEFGDVLGRVSPLTAALGIRYEEMAAALAALTQKGVPAHTAITQLTQVSQKLLRPTKALQALYDEWGVQTGPEAIERFGGLRGVLLKMKDASAGNDTEFANLLGRVRAIVGALNLTTGEADALTEALDAMNNVSGETGDALDKIRESTGRQAVEAWNNLGTEMLKVGEILAEITTPLAKGLQLLVKDTRAIGAAAAVAGVGLIALSAQAAGAAVSMAGLTAALSAMLPILALAAAAWAAVKVGEAIAEWANEAERSAARINNYQKAMTATQERESQARIEARQKEFEEQTRNAGKFFTEMSKEYRKDSEAFVRSSETIGKVLESSLARIMKKRAEAVNQIRKAVEEADDAIKKSNDVVTTAQEKLADLAWKREKRRLGARKTLIAELQRAQDAAAKARQAFAEAGANEEAIAEARKRSEIAETLAEEQIAHAKSMGNLRAMEQGEKALENILKQRIAGEKQFQTEREKLRDTQHQKDLQRLEEAGVATEALLERMRELASVTTAEGAAKTTEQMKADAERIAELTPELAKTLQEAFDFQMFEKLGLPEGLEELKVGVGKAFDEARFDYGRAVAEFKAELTGEEYVVPARIQIVNEGIIDQFLAKYGELDLLKDPGQQSAQMLKILQDIVNRVETAEAKMDDAMEVAVDRAETFRSHMDITTLLSQLDRMKKLVGTSPLPDESVEDYKKRVAEAVPELEKWRQEALKLGDSLEDGAKRGVNVTKEQQDAFKRLIDSAKEMEEQGLLSGNTIQQMRIGIDQLTEMASKMREVASLRESISDIEPGTYEAAQKSLDAIANRSRDAVTAAELLGTNLQEGADIAAGMAESQDKITENAKAGTVALDAQSRKAGELADNLKAASEVQPAGARGEAGEAGAAGFAGAPEEPTAVSIEELNAQVAAAQQLQTELLGVNTQFAQVVTTANRLTETLSVPTESVLQIRDAFAAVEQAVSLVSGAMPGVTEQLTASTSTANALTQALNQSATAVQSIDQSTRSLAGSINAAAGAGNSMAASMKAAAAAAVKAAQACAAAAKQCSGGSVRASTGGRFFADGGRGTDTVPAMLTPGEFVVNAKSARNFFPQLQAINAGQAPVYREQGGSVTNIGDVNVTVQSGEAPSQTVREIASGLRRELRRKTVKLY